MRTGGPSERKLATAASNVGEVATAQRGLPLDYKSTRARIDEREDGLGPAHVAGKQRHFAAPE